MPRLALALAVAASLAGCRTRLYDEVAAPTAPAPCENGRRDPGESDVDCGGCCGPCAIGRACGDALDCQSLQCTGGRCVAPACPGCAFALAAGRPLATGDHFVVADFNRDGNPDVAAGVDASDGALTLLAGTGDGGFRATTLAAPGAPLEAADFDGDGNADLVVGSGQVVTDLDSGNFQLEKRLALLIGRGDGTFREPLDLAASGAASVVAAADFDGDGRLDLASIEPTPGNMATAVLFRWGHGDGTFATTTLDVGEGIVTFATGDFDGNCRPDVAVALGSSKVGVLVNRGGRAFALGDTQPVQLGPLSLAVCDIDRDRKLDLVVGDNQFPVRAQIDLLRGNGDGSFAAARRFSAGYQTTAVACADFNGDGRVDVAVGTQPANGTAPDYPLWVLLGDGAGGFADPASIGLYRGVSQLALADFDRDGKTDVAMNGWLLLNASR